MPKSRPGIVLVQIEAQMRMTVAVLTGGQACGDGSMTTELPAPYAAVAFNNLEILDRSCIRGMPTGGFWIRCGAGCSTSARSPIAALPHAMDAAATAGNLECIVRQ
jgi:alcohol dehydrogenase